MIGILRDLWINEIGGKTRDFIYQRNREKYLCFLNQWNRKENRE